MVTKNDVLFTLAIAVKLGQVHSSKKPLSSDPNRISTLGSPL